MARTTYVSKAEEQAALRQRILAQRAAQRDFIPKPEHRDESFYNQWAHNHNMDIEDVPKFMKIYDEHLEAAGDWEVALAKANESWQTRTQDTSSQTEEPTPQQPEEKTKNNSTQKENDKPDNSSQDEEQNDKQPEEVQQSNNSTQTENDTTNQTQEPEPTQSNQVDADNSSQKEEHKPQEQKEKSRGKKYSRIVQNAKGRTAPVPSSGMSVTPTIAYISQEEREKGDKQFQENLKAMLDNSTLIDVLVDHKDTIKNLRKRGYDDGTICKLFMDSYSFPKVTPQDLEYALNTPKRKKTA